MVSPAHGKVVSIQPDTDPITGSAGCTRKYFHEYLLRALQPDPLSGVIKDKVTHTRPLLKRGA